MITNPRKLEFENRDDIIDYVSKGFVPRKKHFYDVMDKVAYPNSTSTYARYSPKAGIEVVVTDSIIPEEERLIYDYILTRVYENRRKRQKKKIAAYIGIGVLALIFGGGHHSHHDKDEEEDLALCPDIELDTF